MSKMLVAIWMVTYNHEQYIKAAIDSVLMQRTNFDFHLFIGEDCSTDKTRQIINFYAIKHPEKITLYTYKHNIGATQNGQIIYKACFDSGAKYIAMLEGDDYWTDPYKLQKQVDFLEANPEFIMTFHDVKVLTKDGKIHDNFLTKLPVSWETAEDLARYGQYIQTNTVLFRNVIQNIPEIFRKYPFGDFVIELYIAEFGKIKYFEEAMSVYRYQVGIHSTLAASEQARTFHYWMLPLWLYFTKKGNRKMATIILGRIFEYIETVNASEDGELYAKYLFDNLSSENFAKFVFETQQYFKDKIKLEVNDGVNNHLKNAGILYLIKVIIYKVRLVLTIKWK